MTFWKSEFHRAKAQLQAVIEHAARDVAEAELHRHVRKRSKQSKDAAKSSLPKHLRECLEGQADNSRREASKK
jgi:DNA gyrase/topoisomerase IV subunit B